MKKLLIILILFVANIAVAQKPPVKTPAKTTSTPAPTTADVKAQLAKYPIVKSTLCKNCMLWVNPYYKSIADVVDHRPICEFELYTKANNDLANKATFGRTGIFEEWHSLPGQVNEDDVYTAADVKAKKLNPADEIAKGHVQPWVLNRFSEWSCIFSDIYTFNAACEHQKQNVGTEIASEDTTRTLLADRDVKVWGGTFGNAGTFSDAKGVTDVIPKAYWKVLVYVNPKTKKTETVCYWMPNLMTETAQMLPKRHITYANLVKNLGFDPETTLH